MHSAYDRISDNKKIIIIISTNCSQVTKLKVPCLIVPSILHLHRLFTSSRSSVRIHNLSTLDTIARAHIHIRSACTYVKRTEFHDMQSSNSIFVIVKSSASRRSHQRQRRRRWWWRRCERWSHIHIVLAFCVYFPCETKAVGIYSIPLRLRMNDDEKKSRVHVPLRQNVHAECRR